MPPFARLRDQYVVGKLGSYLTPTVTAVDGHLRTLRIRLVGAAPAMAVKIRADVDQLLERRTNLQRETT